MTRSLTLAALLALALTACSGDDPAPAPTTTTPAATTPAAPAATTTAPPASPAPAPPAEADGQGLCDFLEQEIPLLQQAGSPEAARTRFTGDVGLWTVGGAGRQLSDATVLDSLATRDCPDVRTRVLAVLGTGSLDAALG